MEESQDRKREEDWFDAAEDLMADDLKLIDGAKLETVQQNVMFANQNSERELTAVDCVICMF